MEWLACIQGRFDVLSHIRALRRVTNSETHSCISHVQDKQQRQEGGPPLRPLVITTKDRSDVLLSLLAAHTCRTGPHVGGLILADADLQELK